VLRFYEYYQDNEYYYLVTEYVFSAYKRDRLCVGGDLLSKLADQKQFTEVTASNIIKQVLSALDYCHKNNIIHRQELRN
jgi:serine/threonine protein kinase